MMLTELSDVELVTRFQDLVIEEQEKLASQLLHLAELDRRKLFFHYASLRAYLVAEHGLEEWVAERRIRAARMLKRFPSLHGKIETGQINLTLLEIAQSCAHREKLSDPELSEILEAICGMSCRAARREIACRYPQSSEEMPYDRIRPLTAELSEVRFVASEKLLEKLEEIRGLLAHSHPKLSFGELIDHLASDYRERHHPEEKARRAKERAERKEAGEKNEKKQENATEIVKTPTAELLDLKTQESVSVSSEKRTFSNSVKHQLTIQEGYQCRYVDPVTNQRCQSSFGLESDHVQAWALGGKSELANARYLCAHHHRRISFLQFGDCSKYFKPK